MATRRQAREWALQLLVQFDLNPPYDVDDGLEFFWRQQTELELDALEDDASRQAPLFTSQDPQVQASLAEMREFAEVRIRGVWESREALDAKLEAYLQNWSVYRLGTVERTALRLGVWELTNCPDIPVPIVVNEAIDLAKFFSSTKSGRFVNGVLDKFAKDLRAPKAEVFTPGEPAAAR